MPIFLWAVYILFFVCTIIVSVDAVARAKINNVAANQARTDDVVPAETVQTPPVSTLENQEQDKSAEYVPDAGVQTQQPVEIADEKDVSDRSPQGRETENRRSSRANSRETQSRREHLVQI